jgi:Uma2 family endonuclease
MRLMNHPTDEIVEASEHLPADSTLVVQGLDWNDYEVLLGKLEGRRALRVSYDSGKLEIMTVSSKHGFYEGLIPDLALIFCEEFHISFETFGQATWKKKALLKGVDPDGSFYVGDISRTAGKSLDVQPETPPDVFIEVDITRSSLTRFSIFAALGIQEVWRYDGTTCHFYTLTGNSYSEKEESRFLPGLTRKMINDAVELGKTKSQTEARRVFRRTVRALRRKNAK